MFSDHRESKTEQYVDYAIYFLRKKDLNIYIYVYVHLYKTSGKIYKKILFAYRKNCVSWDRSGEVFCFYTFLICELWVYIISSKISNENQSNKISTPRINSLNSSPVLHASYALCMHCHFVRNSSERALCRG